MITTNILKTDYLYFNRVSSSLSVVFKKKEQESLVSFIWLTYSYFFFTIQRHCIVPGVFAFRNGLTLSSRRHYCINLLSIDIDKRDRN